MDNVYDFNHYRTTGEVRTVPKSTKEQRIEHIELMHKAVHDVHTALLRVIFCVHMNRAHPNDPIRTHVDTIVGALNELSRCLERDRISEIIRSENEEVILDDES